MTAPQPSNTPSPTQVANAMIQAVEPLFVLPAAAMLVPMQLATLRTFLSRHKAEFPARYRLDGSGHRRMRLLYASEIHRIRAMVIRGPLFRVPHP